MAMHATDDDKPTYPRPQPGWANLSMIRFSLAPNWLVTADQWFEFWKEQVYLEAEELLFTDFDVERSMWRDRGLTISHAGLRLLFDGDCGVVSLASVDRNLAARWSTASDCGDWIRSLRAEQFGAGAEDLCTLAHHLLDQASSLLQVSLEQRQIALWARPTAASDFEPVTPDRWRLYRIRTPDILVWEDVKSNGEEFATAYKPTDTDADGPSGEVLYSIHAHFPDDVGISRLINEPSKTRGAPVIYDWPRITAKAREELSTSKGLPDRNKPGWTKTAFRTGLIEWCENNGIGSPSIAQIDTHINPIIDELRKLRSAN